METIQEILNKKIQSYGADFQKKLLRHKIFCRWKEIAPENISEDIFPVKIKNNILVLHAKTSVAKDNLKFFAQDIIDSANKILAGGEEIFTKIEIARFYKQKKITKKINIKKPPKITSVEEIILTQEEILECEKNCEDIKNPEIKKIALEGFIKHKKTQKFKIMNGWQKCKVCGNLCAPEKIICDICKVKEKNKMRDEIRQKFFLEPGTKYQKFLRELQKKYPHIAEEISIEVVHSERAGLIREICARVSIGDRDSALAKKLVAIYKNVAEKKLTDSLINHALYELRFDLANRNFV